MGRHSASTAADSEGENLPPAQSPSRSVKVPTLLVVGDKDQYCTTGACTPKSMLANERTYYSNQAGLEAIAVRDSGHDVQRHKNATQTNAAILQWVKDAGPDTYPRLSRPADPAGPEGRRDETLVLQPDFGVCPGQRLERGDFSCMVLGEGRVRPACPANE